MKQLYYLLCIFFLLTGNSCKKKNSTDNEGESDKGKIVGKVTLPTNAPINVNTLRILSPIQEVQISNGEYAIDTFAKKFSTTLIVNASNDIVMMGYNYPGQENHDITPQSTALAMFMSAPSLMSLTEEGRLQILKKVIELPQFTNLVTEVSKCISAGKQVLQGDSSNLALAQAYVTLFDKAAVLRITGYFRPEPIKIRVVGKVIGLENNNVAHSYVAGFYKNGNLQDKKMIKGTKMFASSLKDLYQGIFGSGYSNRDLQEFVMNGDGEYKLKIRSGKPPEGNDGIEFTEAQMENVSLFIFQWIWDNIPLPSECAGEIKDNITNNIKTYLSLTKANSLEEFGNSLQEIAYNYIKNASGFLQKCTSLPQGGNAEQYLKKFNSIFECLDFFSKIGDGMNTACHLFDLFNSRPAIDTCFMLSGNTVSSTCKYPSSMSIIDGNNQSGDANSSLPKSLIVEVRDDQGKVMEDVNVSWFVFQGGGQVTNAFSNTTTNGQTMNTWTLGASGTQTVYAKVQRSDGSDIFGSPAVFSARITDSLELYKASIVGDWRVVTLDGAGNPSVTQYKTYDAEGRVWINREEFANGNPPQIYNPPYFQERWYVVRSSQGYHYSNQPTGGCPIPLKYPVVAIPCGGVQMYR